MRFPLALNENMSKRTRLCKLIRSVLARDALAENFNCRKGMNLNLRISVTISRIFKDVFAPLKMKDN